LFLLVNVLADYSTEGVIGLPYSVSKVWKFSQQKYIYMRGFRPTAIWTSRRLHFLSCIRWATVFWFWTMSFGHWFCGTHSTITCIYCNQNGGLAPR
jgi:hypothetical protein